MNPALRRETRVISWRMAMPVFYFNFWDHKAYVSDPNGIELANLDAPHKRALDVANEIMADGQAQGDDRTGWRFDIKDSTDQRVLTMPFCNWTAASRR